MADRRNLGAVAEEAVLAIPERYPGYREGLIRQLMEILQRQGAGSGQNNRRSEIRRMLEAFGQEIASHTQEDDT